MFVYQACLQSSIELLGHPTCQDLRNQCRADATTSADPNILYTQLGAQVSTRLSAPRHFLFTMPAIHPMSIVIAA